MTTKQTILTFLLLSTLTNQAINSSEYLGSKPKKKLRHRIPSFNSNVVIPTENHFFMQSDNTRQHPYPSLGNTNDYQYKYDPKIYEILFRRSLVHNLTTLKHQVKSEEFLQNHSRHLLLSMEEQKQLIVKNLMRKKYYPQIKSIEWKK